MGIQFIGADLGRGYVKGYTIYQGKANHCLFRSIIGEARELDFTKYTDPIYMEVDGKTFFVGDLAEKESFNPIQNYSDDKTTDVAKKLLYTLLFQLADSDIVKLCIGVPNKVFNKTMQDKIKIAYKGKHIKIIDKINNKIKNIIIMDVNIHREADSALYHIVNSQSNAVELQEKRLGIVVVGFRTSEESYFDINMEYKDRLSGTIEVGNRTVLDIIQKALAGKGISKTLSEIDADEEYNDLKSIGYTNLVERINQDIEMRWINYPEMQIYLAGGTAKHFKSLPEKLKLIDDPQMAVAKGLYYVAQQIG